MQCVTFVKTALLRVKFADTLDRIIIMWIPQNSLDDKSTVVRVIVWPLPEPLFTKTSAAIRCHWVKIQPIIYFQKCISFIGNDHRWMVLGCGHPKTSIMLHNLTLLKKIYIYISGWAFDTLSGWARLNLIASPNAFHWKKGKLKRKFYSAAQDSTHRKICAHCQQGAVITWSIVT